MNTKILTRFLQLSLAGLFILIHFNSKSLAQSTWQEVYTIFQSVGTIDSVDFVATPIDSAYTIIFDQPTANTFAQSKEFKRIDPGHPHSSFLFRKINDGLDADIVLDTGEGVSVGTLLSDEEKELIRQWILWGAPETGVVVDTALLNDYYSGNGIATVPNPPPAPDPADGFQIHFGPYFLAPSSELEYYLKYDPHLADTIEIYRTDVFMGDYSHHFILYRIVDDNPITQQGFRIGHTAAKVELVTGAQFTNSVLLPEKTAFIWPQGALLDMNSHHINATPSVMKAEVYMNIYTQAKGTAKQIMNVDLILGAAPFGLWILNNGTTHTYEDSYIPQNDGLNDIFVWGMTSHTHQWGDDFDIYKRNADGTRGVQYFDASHLYGHPDSTLVGFDYDRPPARTFKPFLVVPKNEGFIQEASYVNTGPNSPVTWGYTSEDEMMIMIITYVTDTTGLPDAPTAPTAIEENAFSIKDNIKIYPNPFSYETTLELPDKELTFVLYNVLGKEVKRMENIHSPKIIIERGDLSSGIYFYKILDDSYSLSTGKLIIY